MSTLTMEEKLALKESLGLRYTSGQFPLGLSSAALSPVADRPAWGPVFWWSLALGAGAALLTGLGLGAW